LSNITVKLVVDYTTSFSAKEIAIMGKHDGVTGTPQQIASHLAIDRVESGLAERGCITVKEVSPAK